MKGGKGKGRRRKEGREEVKEASGISFFAALVII
jgi:hypothetical protein